jgi:putative aldouronate transport system permease protein
MMEDLGIISLKKKSKNRLWRKIYDQRYLFLMSVPFILWVLVFRYYPVWGWTMAFQDYKPYLNFSQQQWVGLLHFTDLFKDSNFYLAMRNTLVMSFLNLVVGFTFPIAFALFVNEIRGKYFKRTIQTISYLPHFVSWVIVAGMFSKLLSMNGGVNQALIALGLLDKPVLWLSKGQYFWGLLTSIDLWKEIGWNSILYLAAMMGIDEELYEAAAIDGAGRFRRMWHVTLPGIRPVVGILMIMSIGNLINIGFEKQFLLKTPLTIDYAQVLDLYILHYGIEISQYAFGTAIGIFKSVISIVLLLLANRVIKRFGEGSAVL